eukprot:TRINITY_DN29996_c0_g1_i9.p1 TRINITY_DN29996_c0_g1~~TRINITY_DN29996_c0_g1_i9.p1  ORF type:complete len:523 (-),score=67.62 TRINITY_DN29996_c0_g1_i9:482-2050(-)
MVISRPRCWHLAFLTTVLNLLLWFVLLLNTGTSIPEPHPENRILLSYEYADHKLSDQTLEPVITGLSSETSVSTSKRNQLQTEDRSPQENLDSRTHQELSVLSESHENSFPHQEQPEYQSKDAEQREVVRYVASEGVLDKFRLFKKHAFAKTGKNWSNLSQRNICLGSQTSVDRLHHLVDILSGWTGPLSLAVFVPDIELAIAKRYISFLTKCFPNIDQQVSFHLVEPLDHPGVYIHEALQEFNPTQQLDCGEYKQFLKQLLAYRSEDMLEWRASYAYPQNLLRNVAKSGCQTEFTYIPDIDMVLSPGMDQRLENLMNSEEVQRCDKCAFVIPTFEIADSVKVFPTSKTQLVEMIANKTARPFHQKLFNINQKSSMLTEKWIKIDENPDQEIGYKVEKYIFKYEPLYVARADTPQFDERFIGFGMTRNTQVYEMHVAGYEFHVLANIFTNHAGFQTLSNRPSWRAKQQEANNAKFDEFAKELTAHYGRDPYNMIEKLPKMNLKNIHVAYSKSTKKSNQKSAK